MKNYLVFSFIILAFVSCKQEAKFTEVNINQRYTVQLPDYLQACADLHENASLQYQNAELDIYAMVIEEKKSTMENYDLDYDLELYYNSIASQAFVDNIKNGKVSPAGRQEINGNKAIVSEITGNFDGKDVYYRMGIIETPYSFYQVLLWTQAAKKEEYLPDFTKVLESFKELPHPKEELPQPKVNPDSVQIQLAY
ncbi:MAG: hypothetical protein IPH89_05635 [Bacteroidetes bacterium]|nr:hypothetical protein [Bacteroidota bacterium]